MNVDPAKWTFPPFSATRDGGYVYGRGTVDDKDNVTAALMTMLMLKRLNVPLDRDVIFLAEAGEEGTTRVGIQFMVEPALPGDRRGVLPGRRRQRHARSAAQVKYASVQTLEKIPRAHRADGARRGRARIGAAQDERDRAPGDARSRRSAAWRAPMRAQRNDRHLLQAARRRSRRRTRPGSIAACSASIRR